MSWSKFTVVTIYLVTIYLVTIYAVTIYNISETSRLRTSFTTPFIGGMYGKFQASDPADEYSYGTSFFTGGGNLSPVNKYHRTNYSLQYEIDLSQTLSFGCELDLYWLRYQKNKGPRAVENGIVVKLTKRL